MNIRQQLLDLISPQKRLYAEIIGQKSADLFIATTPSGATVLLRGNAKIGDPVYYDGFTMQIIVITEKVNWQDLEV